MRIITFDGRLGGDAEVKTSKDGRSYVKFRVANNQFSGGEVKTDWFDVTSYDTYVVEKRADKLVKGTYVIITGSVRTEVNNSNGTLWLNHYVNALNIETPYGAPKGNQPKVESEPELSVYTAGTPSIKVENNESPVAPAYAASGLENGDDLPF